MEIRDGLRACGWTVMDTGDAGKDFPDLVAGKQKETWLLEVKRPGGKESPGQQAKREAWRGGPWIVVTSLADALAQMEHVAA